MGFVDYLKNKLGSSDEIGSDKDTRPFIDDDLRRYRKEKCVVVPGATYFQEALQGLPAGPLSIKVAKKRHPDFESYPVTTSDGLVVGYMTRYAIEESGIQPGETTVAEVCHPIYWGENRTLLYIARSAEAIARRRELDELKIWININEDKWSFDSDAERYDFYDAEVLIKSQGDKKPIFVIMAEGQKLFEVTPRMKCYADIAEREELAIRHLIAEKKHGDYGDFFSVGLYY